MPSRKRSEDERPKSEHKGINIVQPDKGKTRQGITDDFIAMFAAYPIARLEADIKHLKTIDGDINFRDEATGLLIDMYLRGMLAGEQAQEKMAALLEKYAVKVK